ncbi:unnamed protein product [Timema podura]|uniref:Uncharacterized protein n=1 Tax=Timema podura TaxID=61482 RepID=A0ABN7PC13_TIMPD|nr:unnamed protein product [Timema podura]
METFKDRDILMRLICRVCAKEDKYCVDVFGDAGKKNKLEKKIRLCLPISKHPGSTMFSQKLGVLTRCREVALPNSRHEFNEERVGYESYIAR